MAAAKALGGTPAAGFGSPWTTGSPALPARPTAAAAPAFTFTGGGDQAL